MATIKELMASLYADAGMEKEAADQPQAYAGPEDVAGANLAGVGTEAGAAAVGQAEKALKAKKDQEIQAAGGSAIVDQVGDDVATQAAEVADRLTIAAGAQTTAEANVVPQEMLGSSQIAAKVAAMTEDELRSHVTALLTSLVGEGEKTAADPTAPEETPVSEEDVKLAEEFDAAGRIMAEGFYSRLQELQGE